MNRVKPYKDLNSDERRARDAFNNSYCTECFIRKENLNCTPIQYDICLNAYTKGYVSGIKYHRKYIKNKHGKAI